ncbi:MAG: c-type cytochrome [Alphaproteobacteria bacterium]|jgi:sulfide dehydrogenase cytochrome subunit
MTRQAFATLALGLALAAGAARAEGPTVEAIARNCMSCHGEGGVSPGSMPTIYGKSTDWTIGRLKEFRSGKREATIMGRIMKAFADDDIEAVAEYFAARK